MASAGGELQPPTVVEVDGWELTSSSTDQPTKEEAIARLGAEPEPESPSPADPGEQAAPGPEAAEPAESPSSEAPAQDGTKKKQSSSSERVAEVRARISAETRAYHEARRAREWETAELDRLRKEREQLQVPQQGSSTPAPSDKPTWSKYEEEGKSYDDFLDARDTWNRAQVQKEIAAGREREQTERQQAYAEQQAYEFNAKYEERLQAAIGKHADYLDVVQKNLSDVPDNPFINELVRSHEQGPEVLYHLAQNPDEARVASTLQPARWLRDAIYASEIPVALVSYLAQHPQECDRLSRTKPASALVALGEISAQLKGANHGSPSTETVSQAKPPTRPVGGQRPGTPTSHLDAPFSSDWIREENKREFEARKARARRF